LRSLRTALLLLLPALALGQATVRPVSISALTAGNELGIFNGAAFGDQPHSTNYIWADDSQAWIANGFPSTLYGRPLVHTLTTDADTEGDTTVVSFAVSQYSQVVVWHADEQLTKPNWLDTDYTHCSAGLNLYLGGSQASGYCRMVSAGTVNLGGNCPTGGCDSAIPMYVAGVINAARPLETTAEEEPGEPGTVRFTASSVTCNELTTCAFQVERVDGASGFAQANLSEVVNPGNGVLNQAFRTWLDGVSGPKNVSVDLIDVTGNQTMTIEIASAVGATPSAPSTITINIVDQTAPAGAADYYVNNTGSPACSNTNPGTAAAAPWCTIGRSLGVAHPGTAGHVTVWLKGDFRGETIDAVNSGLDATRRLRWCPLDSTVNILGPASGQIDYGYRLDTNFLQYGGCNANELIVDGETIFGTGPGEVERGEDPSEFAHIKLGGRLAGSNNVVVLKQTRTAGWVGLEQITNATRNKLVVEFDQHGSAYWINPGDDGDLGTGDDEIEDYGDSMWTDQSQDPSWNLLIDGGSDGIEWNRGGHGASLIGGKLLLRGMMADGRWGSIATFEPLDGNRTNAVSRQSQDSHIHDYIASGTGSPPDQPLLTPCFTLEGTRTAFTNAVVRNCYGPGFGSFAAAWSAHSRGVRIAHVTLSDLGGPLMYGGEYSPDPGQSRFADFQIKNFIIQNWSTNEACCNEAGNWDDLLLNVEVPAGRTIGNTFSMMGGTIEHASGSCNNVYVQVYGATSGLYSLTQLMAAYPATWNNLTCSADVNLDNAPAVGTDSDFSNWLTHWRPVSDSLSTGTGVALTTTTGPGTSSTTLAVADVTWFPDPKPDGVQDWGAPDVGQWDGAYTIHLEGVGNVTYTDAVLSDDAPAATNRAGTLQLAGLASWASGADVGYSQSVGGTTPAPNRGVAR
jgi:hypothetical protein